MESLFYEDGESGNIFLEEDEFALFLLIVCGVPQKP